MMPDFGAMREGMAEFLDLFRRQVEATELLAANTEAIRQEMEYRGAIPKSDDLDPEIRAIIEDKSFGPSREPGDASRERKETVDDG